MLYGSPLLLPHCLSREEGRGGEHQLPFRVVGVSEAKPVKEPTALTLKYSH